MPALSSFNKKVLRSLSNSGKSLNITVSFLPGLQTLVGFGFVGIIIIVGQVVCFRKIK